MSLAQNAHSGCSPLSSSGISSAAEADYSDCWPLERDSLSRGWNTLAVRAGSGPDPQTGAVVPPIHQTATYVQDGIGCYRGDTYTRSSNPTVTALEQALAQLEGVPHCLAFRTGMAAISALAVSVLKSGDRVVVSDVVYGGTFRLLRQILEPLGVEAVFVDTSSLEQVERALAAGRGRTRLVLVETPANPTLKLTDLAGVGRLAKAAGALFCVDNTFLTAVLQHPADCGADVIAYSTTKYLDGHNSTVGGALLHRDATLHQRLREVRNTLGSIQAPFDAWLTLRGLRTLPLRLKQHSSNALAVAEFLSAHPDVTQVHYPGLSDFPQAKLARRQQRSGGGMLTLELRSGEAGARALVEELKLFLLAENLGAAESLITHPTSMTHAAVPVEDRHRLGISDGLLRLSVGLEDAPDLIADLDQALKAVREIAVKQQVGQAGDSQ